MALPKQGEHGGQCVKYAGETYFGKRFGVNAANQIWNSVSVKTYGTDIPLSLSCLAIWHNGTYGHVGVVESAQAVGNVTTFRFSDSNRSPAYEEKVDIRTKLTKAKLEGLCTNFKGYAKFK